MYAPPPQTPTFLAKDLSIRIRLLYIKKPATKMRKCTVYNCQLKGQRWQAAEISVGIIYKDNFSREDILRHVILYMMSFRKAEL